MKNIPINELLKEKRIEKKISMDTIFKEIHIPSKFIYLIEDGEWEKFPSKVHLKGFLRIYGDYLKIEPSLLEKCLKETSESYEGKKDAQDDNSTGKNQQKIFKPYKSLYLLLLLAVILIVLYLVILYLLPE